MYRSFYLWKIKFRVYSDPIKKENAYVQLVVFKSKRNGY